VTVKNSKPLEVLKHHVSGAIERGEKTAIKAVVKPTESEVLDYISRWVRDDGWCDLSIAVMNGETEIAAHMIVQTGCIHPDKCYDWAKPFEKEVVRYANKFNKLSRKTRSKMYNELFKDVFISSCDDCNHVSFVHSENEELYDELKTECWECKSKNIETRRGLK
jgi:GTP-binding protein EngB required for normal cell division